MKSTFKTKFTLKTIKDICISSVSGGTPSKSNQNYWKGNIPWASPKDIKKHFIYDTEDHITEEALKESSTKLIPENSLLIVFRGLQGYFNTSINKVPLTINQDLKALTFISGVNSEYISYIFEIFQKYVFPLITKQSTTVQSINTEQFVDLKIPIPPIKIQNKIVELMNNAYIIKQQKEQEAENLLSFY